MYKIKNFVCSFSKIKYFAFFLKILMTAPLFKFYCFLLRKSYMIKWELIFMSFDETAMLHFQLISAIIWAWSSKFISFKMSSGPLGSNGGISTWQMAELHNYLDFLYSHQETIWMRWTFTKIFSKTCPLLISLIWLGPVILCKHKASYVCFFFFFFGFCCIVICHSSSNFLISTTQSFLW